MAYVNAYSPINMLNAQTWDGYVTNATSTNITIADYYTTAYYSGYGFTYYGSSLVGGMLTGYSQYYMGSLQGSITGLSVSAPLAASYIQSNNLPGLFSIALGGNDYLDLSDYDDLAVSYGGNDTIYARGGDDDVWGGEGADTIDGGSGADFARYDFATSGVYVRLDTGRGYTGEATGDLLTSIEALIGSAHADTLVGDSIGNFIDGRSGSDHLFGEGGDDYLFGDSGDDYLFGDSGNDLLAGGAGLDTLFGGAGNDTFVFMAPTDGADSIDFTSGEDHFQLSAADFSHNLAGTLASAGINFELGTSATAPGPGLVYDRASGNIYWDADGTGQQTEALLANVRSTYSTSNIGGNLDWKPVTSGDFNGDGTDDIVWRSESTGQDILWTMANGQPSSVQSIGGNLDWKPVTSGDFNGDGTDDIVWRSESTGQDILWTMANGQPSSVQSIGGNLDWKPVTSGDFNGDGTDDIVWRSESTGQDNMWLNGQHPDITQSDWLLV
ncbi:FG-GAP-like repeat-containing protein [Phyllobacterium lublinensis]|uniref:FG-GAP-like repeat-containing protein n=1 Tax=Phyllobacterium lublinensis TaxID=2875708 RepID=UPI001CCA14E4|nr:FG-GAP-like repeat-containing protein [Phyllobacterium sp. 2063]MBZ9655793.1 FG-GAP-like repeat-containing protein [Phyllobacterium sp. 2063]